MVLQFRHFFFHGIKEKKCYSLIIPPWRKYHSTTEEKSFHHGGTIFSTRWNDLIVAYKYTNRKEEKQENSHKKHIFTLEMKHIKNTHQTHFRVMKKIYPKKWLELHPYKQTNSVDQYYVGIANEIHKRLYSSTIADAFEEEETYAIQASASPHGLRTSSPRPASGRHSLPSAGSDTEPICPSTPSKAIIFRMKSIWRTYAFCFGTIYNICAGE